MISPRSDVSYVRWISIFAGVLDFESRTLLGVTVDTDFLTATLLAKVRCRMGSAKWFISFTALGLAACAGGDPSSGGAGSEGPPATQVETANTQEALGNGNGEHCDTTAADAVIVRNGASSSSDSYTHADCAGAFVVDLKGGYLSGGLNACGEVQTGAGGSSAVFCPASTTVAWDAAVPTDQATCTAARVIAYLWDTTDPTPVFIGAATKFGTWVSGACIPPAMDIGASIASLVNGRNYRFGLSARQGSSSSATRRLSMRAE